MMLFFFVFGTDHSGIENRSWSWQGLLLSLPWVTVSSGGLIPEKTKSRPINGDASEQCQIIYCVLWDEYSLLGRQTTAIIDTR